MLKIIGILSLAILSVNTYAYEYEVVISDDLTGDVLVESCANELELNDVVDYAQSLKNESVKFSVRKLISIGPVVMKVGGEGGGD
jgi:hypothetical protein